MIIDHSSKLTLHLIIIWIITSTVVAILGHAEHFTLTLTPRTLQAGALRHWTLSVQSNAAFHVPHGISKDVVINLSCYHSVFPHSVLDVGLHDILLIAAACPRGKKYHKKNNYHFFCVSKAAAFKRFCGVSHGGPPRRTPALRPTSSWKCRAMPKYCRRSTSNRGVPAAPRSGS